MTIKKSRNKRIRVILVMKNLNSFKELIERLYIALVKGFKNMKICIY